MCNKVSELIKVPYHKPLYIGNELAYVEELTASGKFSGNGVFTARVSTFLKEKLSFKSCLLTHSCTGALEMAALLIGIEPGDEVILPAYTFVSTANAFLLRGAKLIFVDSQEDHPNLNVEGLEKLINSKTKAIVAVHYAGYSLDMKALRKLCDVHRLFLIEDAAQALGSKDEYGNDVGTIADFAAFSFHDSKLIHCGEGGALIVNRDDVKEKAEIIWEKGTNKSAFLRGEISSYEWKEIGSSFLLSELNAAFLWGQLQKIDQVLERQTAIWENWMTLLTPHQSYFKLPPKYAKGNGYIFYLVLNEGVSREDFIGFMRKKGVQTPFHYQNLAKSSVVQSNECLRNADKYAEQLIRLPSFNTITKSEQKKVRDILIEYGRRL